LDRSVFFTLFFLRSWLLDRFCFWLSCSIGIILLLLVS
jgi:hypothetical protein